MFGEHNKYYCIDMQHQLKQMCNKNWCHSYLYQTENDNEEKNPLLVNRLNLSWNSKKTYFILTAINTNNGVESLNKLMKYEFFPHASDKNLSTIIEIIIKRYCTSAYHNYVKKNVSYGAAFKTTNSKIPHYLKGETQHGIEIH